MASIQRVTDIMGEISAASQEQTRGIEQVNQAVAQMDRVTQQNAALVEEAAAAAQSMREQAAGLVDAVAVFKTDARAAQVHAARAVAAAQVASKPAAHTPRLVRHEAAGRRERSAAPSSDWAEF